MRPRGRAQAAPLLFSPRAHGRVGAAAAAAAAARTGGGGRIDRAARSGEQCVSAATFRPSPAQRANLLTMCEQLEARGVRLTRPVAMLLDGERDRATLADGLDEADRVVALQMLDLIEAGGRGTLDGLSLAEREALTAEFATSDERAEARKLHQLLDEKSKTLAKKEQEVKALKMKIIKQQLAMQPTDAR